MKRWVAALGSLAVVCFLTACSSSVAGTSPASPGPFASQADQVVADLAAGNFTALVTITFNPNGTIAGNPNGHRVALRSAALITKRKGGEVLWSKKASPGTTS